MLRIDVLGYTYDDDAPSFIDCGGYWFHRISSRLLEKASLAAWMSANSKTFGAKEKGDLTAGYALLHHGIQAVAAAQGQPAQPQTVAPSAVQVTQPSGLPITGNAQGTISTTVDLSFGGSALSSAATATIVYNIGTADVQETVQLAQGVTAHEAAVEIAAAMDQTHDLTALAQGSGVRVTPGDGITLSKLTVSIA